MAGNGLCFEPDDIEGEGLAVDVRGDFANRQLDVEGDLVVGLVEAFRLGSVDFGVAVQEVSDTQLVKSLSVDLGDIAPVHRARKFARTGDSGPIGESAVPFARPARGTAAPFAAGAGEVAFPLARIALDTALFAIRTGVEQVWMVVGVIELALARTQAGRTRTTPLAPARHTGNGPLALTGATHRLLCPVALWALPFVGNGALRGRDEDWALGGVEAEVGPLAQGLEWFFAECWVLLKLGGVGLDVLV